LNDLAFHFPGVYDFHRDRLRQNHM